MTVHLSFAIRTDTGRVRSRNEDAVQVDPAAAVLVVADGMGGHPAGDVASRLAAAEVARLLATSDNLGADAGAEMARAVRAADERVRLEGRTDPTRVGMGSTVTALHLDRDSGRFVIGHVGDSRAYRWRAGLLERLTRDDTWVQAQVDAGRLTEEQARRHPWSSVLSQAVGLEQPAEPNLVEGQARAGDLYLLCSDGLNAMLADEEVEEVLRQAGAGAPQPDLERVAAALVAAANERGGVDNITVGLVAVTPAG